MKKFWLVTYSATAAVGWVAVAQASGQAMDEAILEPSIDRPDIAPPPALAVEPVTPIEIEVAPPAPAPAPEPTWTIPEPQPQTSYIEPTPAPLEEAAAVEDSVIIPEIVEESAASAHNNVPGTSEATLPSQPRFIEQDPIIRAVINPQTPEEEALAAQLKPEDIIRDGRSFEELLSSSPEAPELHLPPPTASVPPAASAVQSSANSNTPLLNQLDQDWAAMQREVRAEQASIQFTLPAPQPLAIDAEFEALQAELSGQEAAIALESQPELELELSAWDVATLGATFTRSEFNVYTFAANFFTDEEWLTTDWQTVGLDTFDTELVAQLAPTEWSVEFADLETGTAGFLSDETFSVDSATPPLPSFESSGQLVLNFSAFDVITNASPLGTNPLTFGYEEDILVASVLEVLRSPNF